MKCVEVIGLHGFPSIEFDTFVLNLSYVLLLWCVLPDSYLQDMFLALKLFVLEGQDLKFCEDVTPGPAVYFCCKMCCFLHE